MLKRILHFFDKLEDRVRGSLSRRPIAYALVAGAGVVIFWRGVWHTADFIMEASFITAAPGAAGLGSAGLPWWDGPLSIVVGAAFLLMTGAFVSSFIGSEIIISGLRGEKKATERTESELREEAGEIEKIRKEIAGVERKLEEIEEKLD